MEKTACFSGHRIISLEKLERVTQKTAEAIQLLYASGVRTFKAGGALGYDTLAALTVLEFRKHHPDVRLVLELISPDQANSWNKEDKSTFELIKMLSDEIRYAADEYTTAAIFKRNRNLVDECSHCVCYLTKSSGGTAYTVKYAKSLSLEIINTAIL